MLKIFLKYYSILILSICLIIGLIRQDQIQTYQSSIGKPTMTGIFTLYSYIFVGISLTLISILLNLIYRSKLGNTLKIVLKVTVFVIGLPLVCISLLLLH